MKLNPLLRKRVLRNGILKRRLTKQKIQPSLMKKINLAKNLVIDLALGTVVDHAIDGLLGIGNLRGIGAVHVLLVGRWIVQGREAVPLGTREIVTLSGSGTMIASVPGVLHVQANLK